MVKALAMTDVETWFYWDSEKWAEASADELDEVKPDIICGRLAGQGALDPRLRIAVGDQLSMQVVEAQHRRFLRGNRGKK